MPYRWFVVSILSIWLFSLILTLLGPAMYQERYFARAAAWVCSLPLTNNTELTSASAGFQENTKMKDFGYITSGSSSSSSARSSSTRMSSSTYDTSKLTRATKFMVMYPFVYVVLTLPIAVGRMVAMTGTEPPDLFFIVAGCLLTSCGWIDALLYALTRRVLVSGDLSTGNYNRTVTATLTNAARPGDDDHYGLQSMSGKEALTSTTARTVTIVGGSNRLSRIVDHRRGRSHTLRSRHEDTLHEDESPTRTGSADSILKNTETSVQVETAEDKAFEAGRPRSKDWSDDYSRGS